MLQCHMTHKHSPRVLQTMALFRYTATHDNTLQHTATHCNTLQHIFHMTMALFRHNTSFFKKKATGLFCTGTGLFCEKIGLFCDLRRGYYTLQHTATHCNTLQHTATHCNTLQHTARCGYFATCNIHACLHTESCYTYE